MTLTPALMRTFNEAFDHIEKVASLDTDPESEVLQSAFVYSGGTSEGTSLENIPGTFTNEQAAVDAFQRSATLWLRAVRAKSFRYIEAPKVERLVMTEQDSGGSQRLTVARFGVTSKMGVTAKWEIDNIIGRLHEQSAKKLKASAKSRSPKPKKVKKGK